MPSENEEVTPKVSVNPDLKSSLQKWQEDEEIRASSALEIIIGLMREHGVKCVIAEYSGEGDSGSITEVNVALNPVEIEDWPDFEPDTAGYNRLKRSKTSDQIAAKVDKKFHFYPVTNTSLELIEHLAAELTPSGYEINEGGQGVIVFDAVAGECRCEHGSNYTEVNYDTRTVSLPEEEDDAEVP